MKSKEEPESAEEQLGNLSSLNFCKDCAQRPGDKQNFYLTTPSQSLY